MEQGLSEGIRVTDVAIPRVQKRRSTRRYRPCPRPIWSGPTVVPIRGEFSYANGEIILPKRARARRIDLDVGYQEFRAM